MIITFCNEHCGWSGIPTEFHQYWIITCSAPWKGVDQVCLTAVKLAGGKDDRFYPHAVGLPEIAKNGLIEHLKELHPDLKMYSN